MPSRSKIADEQPSSLGGWLFADLFLLLVVIGLAGFTIATQEGAPQVTTGSAMNVAVTSTKVTGLLDTGDNETSAFFRWGTSSNLGGDVQVVGADESPVGAKKVGVDISASLNNLKPNQTYYFQAGAKSSSGSDNGDIRSFKTSEEDKGQCSDAPSFIKVPFTETYTDSKARRQLRSDIEKWVNEKGFVRPKVAVAFVTGWSNNPEGNEGAVRARRFYNQVMTQSASEFFDENTALRAIQNSERVPDNNFEVQLFFVEQADEC
jgi:hypothetical protein